MTETKTVHLKLSAIEPCSRVHVWDVFMNDAWGFHSKRDDGVTTDVFWFRGNVRICVCCTTLKFYPHNPEYSAQECVMVDPIDFGEIKVFQVQAA